MFSRLSLVLLVLSLSVVYAGDRVDQWDVFELTLAGPDTGNPFTDVELRAFFSRGETMRAVQGFYDGNGVYKIRFMPDIKGKWKWSTRSNVKSLNGKKGHFVCVQPDSNNHGPVKIINTLHFMFMDQTPFKPLGVTAYAWAQQSDSMQATTLNTLAHSPFNKVRMMVLPQTPDTRDVVEYPFAVDKDPGKWDFDQLNPLYFQKLETCVEKLRDLDMVADLVLFHPYNLQVFNYDKMSDREQERYVEYVVARLGAFRNVWWCLANEYDYLGWSESTWDRLFQVVRDADPYKHPRSIHNGSKWYDHNKPWVTHVSVNSQYLGNAADICMKYNKPVIFDEMGYEGIGMAPILSVNAREMVYRCWQGIVNGCYVNYGETLEQQFFMNGGALHGSSVERITFLAEILKDSPLTGMNPVEVDWMWRHIAAGEQRNYYLLFFGPHNISHWKLPDGGPWQVDVIGPWEMTVTPMDSVYRGGEVVELLGKSNMALRIKRAKNH